MFTGILPHNSHFYPRSPCGERPRTGSTCGGGQNISIHALLAESDSLTLIIGFLVGVFLSTLSLRRATWPGLLARPFFIISIHALLAESDGFGLARLASGAYFYPRSPCGERPRVS